MRKSTIRKAFTLVEILIVVVILGILAAIVVPQFTSATQDSQAGNIRSQLGTLQRQIELYQAKNNVYPTWSTNDAAGKFGWNSMVAGGYIKDAPVNPAVAASATDSVKRGVATAAATGSTTTGWVWDNTAGVQKLFASNFNETTGAVSATATD